MKRQIRETERKHESVDRRGDAHERDGGQRQTYERAERKQDAPYDEHARGSQQPRETDDAPCRQQRKTPLHENGWRLSHDEDRS